MKPSLASVLCAFALVASPALAKEKLKTLEGTRFELEVDTGERTDARGEKSFTEVVSFQDGKVSFSTLGGRGYPTTDYVARKDGSKWEVSFEHQSPTDGKMVWKGDVREDWFKGVVLWTRKDGKERNFLFKGQLVREGKNKK